MNTRKCHKCGGCVPEGNVRCNHCGQKMFLFGGNSLYVGSSQNANTIDSKENPFSDGKNGAVGWIIFLIIAIPTILIITTLIEEFSSERLDFEYIFGELFNDIDEEYDVIIGENDYDEDDSEDDNLNDTCFGYCGNNNFSIVNGGCICHYNGSSIDNSSSDSIFDDILDPNLDPGTDSSGIIGSGDEVNISRIMCSSYCATSSSALNGSVCYCSNNNRYDSLGHLITYSDNVVAREIMKAIDENKRVFIYGPGKSENNSLDPVNVLNAMNNFDYKSFYLNFNNLEGTIRNDLRYDYEITNYIKPHYYIFDKGVLVETELGDFKLEDLEKIAREYLMKSE